MNKKNKSKGSLLSRQATAEALPIPQSGNNMTVIDEKPYVSSRPMYTISKNSMSSSYKLDAPPNEKRAKEFLSRHRWPVGVQNAFIKSCKKFPVRFIITDDSGSMMTNDGHRLIGSIQPNGKSTLKLIQCTRWSELTSSLKFQAELAHQAQAITEFRLLNITHNEPIVVGNPSDTEGEGLARALEVCESTNSLHLPKSLSFYFYHMHSIMF